MKNNPREPRDPASPELAEDWPTYTPTTTPTGTPEPPTWLPGGSWDRWDAITPPAYVADQPTVLSTPTRATLRAQAQRAVRDEQDAEARRHETQLAAAEVRDQAALAHFAEGVRPYLPDAFTAVFDEHEVSTVAGGPSLRLTWVEGALRCTWRVSHGHWDMASREAVYQLTCNGVVTSVPGPALEETITMQLGAWLDRLPAALAAHAALRSVTP